MDIGGVALGKWKIKFGKSFLVAAEAGFLILLTDIADGGMLMVLPGGAMIQNRDWLMVTVKLKHEYHELYEGKGPVLYAEQIVHSPAPEQPLATFY